MKISFFSSWDLYFKYVSLGEPNFIILSFLGYHNIISGMMEEP